jgi:ABC-type bacteriocin/lantibiotic exporter with double-glycine peptidase domain
MTTAAKVFERRRFVTEVVQTSSMDCGPAALKCLLEGFNVSASYGRLREACQTDVDGTSIDTIEDIACDLGLIAEQCIIPIDHATMDESALLPAIAVVAKTTDAATHFVVVWRRHGRWLQIMDPAVGRRWVQLKRFNDELYRHSQSVDAEDWRDWASTDEFLVPLAARLARLGIAKTDIDALIADALADPVWLPIAGLDASVRLVQSMVDAKGVRRGDEALNVVRALYRDTSASHHDVQAFIPSAYWSVSPDPESYDQARRRLMVKGAVLLTVKGLREPVSDLREDPELSLELAAALSEKPVSPLVSLWRMLVADGLVTPFALIVAMAVAAGALMLEALLFRGLFDIASQLALPSQRLFAGVGLILFVAILLGTDIAIGLQTLRMGRKLETRLRMALLEKLPKLNDRYFQSRPITDMADRNHNIHLTRGVPSTGLQLVQSVFELILTFIGVVLIAPDSIGMAILLIVVAITIPFITQQLLNERDLRVRNHAGALHSFYLDALLGITPVRAHRAERNVQGQHEGLLVEWALSLRGLIRMSLMTDGVQALICTGLAGALLIKHFIYVGGVSGADLLLVFWALKLPAIGARLAGIAHQYPAQRNVLLRLMEPLNAPDAIEPERDVDQERRTLALGMVGKPVGFTLENATVLAGGHEILRDVSLSVAPGEHVAIVGLSGAGKSSMLALLLGWHRLASGRLLVDDMPLDSRAVEALRQVTAWVDPAIQIWNRSLLDNLIYAADAEAIDRVGDVIGAAKLRAVAQKLPQGLQSLLGEGGGMLSGGEGQRVRLGRALMSTDSRLVLLDEPFRGMDRTQRQTLLVEARAWWQQVTMLCVTHDVSETMAFPRVLVVEEGRIVEDGAPAKLSKQSSRYRELLEAEAAVAKQIWRGDYWRRLEMAGGRLLETGRLP